MEGKGGEGKEVKGRKEGKEREKEKEKNVGDKITRVETKLDRNRGSKRYKTRIRKERNDRITSQLDLDDHYWVCQKKFRRSTNPIVVQKIPSGLIEFMIALNS